ACDARLAGAPRPLPRGRARRPLPLPGVDRPPDRPPRLRPVAGAPDGAPSRARAARARGRARHPARPAPHRRSRPPPAWPGRGQEGPDRLPPMTVLAGIRAWLAHPRARTLVVAGCLSGLLLLLPAPA